jgi:hypothetical protein
MVVASMAGRQAGDDPHSFKPIQSLSSNAVQIGVWL